MHKIPKPTQTKKQYKTQQERNGGKRKNTLNKANHSAIYTLQNAHRKMPHEDFIYHAEKHAIYATRKPKRNAKKQKQAKKLPRLVP